LRYSMKLMKTEYTVTIKVGDLAFTSDVLGLPSARGWIAQQRVELGELYPGQPWEIYMTANIITENNGTKTKHKARGSKRG